MKFGLQSTLAKKIGRRYGQALFNSALERNIVDGVLADTIFLIDTLNQSVELADFFRNPHNPPDLTQAVLRALFHGRITPLTFDFLSLVITKGRQVLLPEILGSFINFYHTYHRITRIRVISAVALSTAQVRLICQKLQARHHHEYFAETELNPDLIGGFQIVSGDEVLDFSMKNQLEHFRRQVINA